MASVCTWVQCCVTDGAKRLAFQTNWGDVNALYVPTTLLVTVTWVTFNDSLLDREKTPLFLQVHHSHNMVSFRR